MTFLIKSCLPGLILRPMLLITIRNGSKLTNIKGVISSTSRISTFQLLESDTGRFLSVAEFEVSISRRRLMVPP